MDPTTMDRLFACAASQRGLVTRRQLVQAGVAEPTVDTWRRRGRLVTVAPAVYALPGVPVDPLRPVLAAVLAAGPGAAASMQTAAILLGLGQGWSPVPVHVCVMDTTPDALAGVVTHRTRRLERCDLTEAQGIPVTSAARTLIDLAAVLDRVHLTALVDEAIGAGLVSRSWLHRRALALRSGRRGVGILVSLTADDAGASFRSWLERRASQVLEQAGVPSPQWNHPVREHGRLLGIADACWRREGVIAEFDGLRFHSTPAQRRDDAERERRLTLAGWRVLRFTWQDVVHCPEDVAAAVTRALTLGVSENRS